MNIFVLDTDIERCARYHCDAHVSKMILESVQVLCTALNAEYRYRYAKLRDHASIAVLDRLEDVRFESAGLTEFAQAMPDRYKVPGDAVTAYRAFYLGEKHAFARWTRRPPPDWWMRAAAGPRIGNRP